MSTIKSISVRELRRKWKPHKDRIVEEEKDQSTSIRFHRACSWLERIENQSEIRDYDLDLLSLWISFNSLYGQWDTTAKEPKSDRQSWKNFIELLLSLDTAKHLEDVLVEHKKLVISLVEDEYLFRFFWKDPSTTNSKKARNTKHKAQGWYREKRWIVILENVLERVYLLRCQLVHGAATYNGKLNRTSLRRCTTMMEKILPAMLLVWIDYGADQDWGEMCYPPIDRLSSQSKQSFRSRPR